MSRTTSIIPEELEAIISSLKPGKPTWTLYKTEKGYAGSFSGRTIAMEAVLHLMPTQVGDTSVVSDAWRNSFRKSTRKASIELIRTPKKRYKVQPNPKLIILLHLQLRGVKLETAAQMQHHSSSLRILWSGKTPPVPNRQQPWKQGAMWKVEA